MKDCHLQIVVVKYLLIYRGQIIRNLGDVLSSELKECLPIFLERLKNEITRLTAVKALTMIAGYDIRLKSSCYYAPPSKKRGYIALHLSVGPTWNCFKDYWLLSENGACFSMINFILHNRL